MSTIQDRVTGTVRDMTYGEIQVGANFNPGGLKEVWDIKEQFAAAIDTLNDLRMATENGEVKRMLSIAITESQTAQMWAVKAVTWKV